MVSRAKQWSELEHGLFRDNLAAVEADPDGRIECLSTFLLERQKELGLERDEIAYNVRSRDANQLTRQTGIMCAITPATRLMLQAAGWLAHLAQRYPIWLHGGGCVSRRATARPG